MGGIGSGARRSSHTANVEDVLALDVRVLRRLGALRVGCCIITHLRWSKRGLSALEVRLRADMHDDRGAIALRSHSISQSINVETIPTEFGGRRCYLVCPITGDRREVLYLVNGQFASRRGHGLSYASQNMTDLSRARRRAAKLRARLDGDAGFARPRGCSRIEKVERFEVAQTEARILYLDQLRRYAAPSGSRH